MMDEIETFSEAYLGLNSKYQILVYTIPLFAYQDIFKSIEYNFNNSIDSKPEQNSAIDYMALLSSSAKNFWQWVQHHPRELVLGGLLASAWYQAQTQDKYHYSLQWSSDVMVSLGVHQVLQARGIQSFVPLAFYIGSDILPIAAQNNPFFTVIGGNNSDQTQALWQTSDNGLVIAGTTTSFGAGGYDVLLAKFAANGTFLWAKTLGGSGGDGAIALQKTSDNDLVMTGTTYSFGAANGHVLLTMLSIAP